MSKSNKQTMTILKILAHGGNNVETVLIGKGFSGQEMKKLPYITN